ncbi:MAG: hypothetical protein RLZZ338_2684 [Cyanobacteriota bacterium]|jgi:uncharacterized membrane protein
MTTVHPIQPTPIRLGLPPKGWRFLIIILLIFGILFRLVNIDHKIYWTDEVYTSLRISGYTEKEFLQNVAKGEAITQKELHSYQKLNANKTVFDTVKGLALEEPQMTPLYFILIRFWAQLFGDSIATIRSFSAVINLLSFPLVYWLCVELFQSSLVGWVALGLFSVSPLQIVYAQEARPYSLFVAAILLSHIALWRALGLKTNKSYGFYALTVVLGLYSHLLFAFVALGHGIYVLLIEKSRWTPTVKNYIWASAIALLGFTPWIFVLLRYSKSATEKLSWQSFKFSPLDILKNWILNIVRIFFDVGFYTNYSKMHLIFLLPCLLISLLLIVYALYFLFKKKPLKNPFYFLLISIILLPCITLLYDIGKGSFLSLVTRYYLPSAIGIELAVSYLISSQITESTRKKLWQGIFILMTSLGLFSGVIMTQNSTWWNKYTLSDTLKIAPLIKSSKSTLVVTDFEPQNSGDFTYEIGSLMCLSYQLDPQIKYQVVLSPNMPQFSQNDFSDLFLYNPAPMLTNSLTNDLNWKLKFLYESHQYPRMFLWKLERRSRS